MFLKLFLIKVASQKICMKPQCTNIYLVQTLNNKTLSNTNYVLKKMEIINYLWSIFQAIGTVLITEQK